MQPEPQVQQEPQHTLIQHEPMTEAIKKNEANIKSLARTLPNAVETVISKRLPQQIKLQEQRIEEKMAQHTLNLDKMVVEQTTKLQHDMETLMANMLNDVGALLGKGPSSTPPSASCLLPSATPVRAAPKRPRRPPKGKKQSELKTFWERDVELQEPDTNDSDQKDTEQEGEQVATIGAPPGTTVMARHLQTEFLNGQRGCVERADGSRLRVLFDGDIGYKRVRPENLLIVSAPCCPSDCSDTISSMKDDTASTTRASRASSCPPDTSNDIMTNITRASSGPYPSTTPTSTISFNEGSASSPATTETSAERDRWLDRMLAKEAASRRRQAELLASVDWQP